MKDNLRIVLYALAAGLLFMLWQRWQIVNHPVQETDVIQQQQAASSPKNADISRRVPAFQSSQDSVPVAADDMQALDGTVRVHTDVLDLTFSNTGATLINGKLLDYPVSVEDKNSLPLLHQNNPQRMLLETGLVAENRIAPSHFDQWQSSKQQYSLEKGQDTLEVPFVWEQDGLCVVKTFVFKRGAYHFSVVQTVENGTAQPWRGFAYEQFAFGEPAGAQGLGHIATFTGAVSSSEESRYQKIKLSEIADPRTPKLKIQGTQGWVAMMQHYFIGALIPQPGQEYTQYTQYDDNNHIRDHIIGVHSGNVSLAPGQSHVFTVTAYVGPKIKQNLDQLAPYLDKTIDYGYLFMISQFMFSVMEIIHHFVGNWGWSIIFMTLLIKLIFFVPSAWAYKSMAKMRALQPEMARLKERYGDDRQAMSQEIMKLYRKEKVNPASGCLPMLLQIPFFIAFYWVLAESVQLRLAPWIGWIHDLSAMDPYFILPVINATLMFLQQKLNPPPPDPMQAKIMMMMPLVFGFMFMWFPSGLVLYWTVSNAFSIVQQYVMNKRYGAPHRPHNHHKADAKT